jgi:hypothetical protein
VRSLSLVAAFMLLLPGCRSSSAASGGAAASASGPEAAPTPDPNDPRAQALAELSRRVDAYVALHRAAQATVPAQKAGASAAEITSREKALAQALQARRAGAKPGDVFTPTVKPLLVSIIRGYLSTPEAAPAKARVEQENPRVETPGAPVSLKVNAPYDADASLSTVPAPLLLKLPKLPEEVEFRFVGKHLVLRDAKANLIVDYLLDVAP